MNQFDFIKIKNIWIAATITSHEYIYTISHILNKKSYIPIRKKWPIKGKRYEHANHRKENFNIQ